MSVETDLIRAHRLVAKSSGELALMLGRRKVNFGVLQILINDLKEAREILEGLKGA